MSAKKKLDSAVDEENPEWTKEDFAKSRPAEEMPAEILAQFKNRPGRPKLENPKEPVKLRLDPDVVAALRKSGPGWQTRVNDLLRSKLKESGRIDIGVRDKNGALVSKRPKRQGPPSSKQKRA
jgi:uncharacterized protein (DUF4415 family)